MVKSYDDVYKVVEAAVNAYMQKQDSTEIAFEINDNGSCTIVNKQNRKKFVLMFAQFADEFKVGFAFYEPDELGNIDSPEWIEDTFNYDFNGKFVTTLITEHLI